MICVEQRYFRAISRDKMFRLGVEVCFVREGDLNIVRDYDYHVYKM